MEKNQKNVLKEPYNSLIEEYLESCRQKGNGEWIMWFKRKTCVEFFSDMEKYGKDLSTLDAATVGKICASKGDRKKWRIYRVFLRFLFEKNMIQRDLSIVVPVYREKQPLPSVYSVGEIHKIENAIDRSTVKGKRDYAIVLLASRMGLRRSDIVELTFDSVDFENNRIHLIQKKTKEELDVLLIADVRSAIKEYLKAMDMEMSSGRIFPQITPKYITDYVRELMLKSGIEIKGRRTGPHALRNSMATSMINDGVSYEVIRRVLGHNDYDTVRKYAKLDIEHLRKCALEVPAPQGRYRKILEGDERL